MDDLDRFLALVCRELECEDARFELGGRAPHEGCWVELQGGWRVVAVLAQSEMTPDARALRQTKLETLIASFSGIANGLKALRPPLEPQTPATGSELDEVLEALAQRAGAIHALVIDQDSPVVWGCSKAAQGPEDVDERVRLGERAEQAAAAELEPAQHARVLGWRAITGLRRTPTQRLHLSPDFSWLARDFGGIYQLVLVYGAPFSEPRAREMLRRALPVVERLVAALPPFEPPPEAGRVLRFPR